MGQSANVRTLHAAILPPGPTHIHGLSSLAANDNIGTVLAASFSSALVSDFLVKVTGVSNIQPGVLEQIPLVRNHNLESQLILRTLRLNCLVLPYAPLWLELYSSAWQRDAWVPGLGVDYTSRAPLGAVGRQWEWATPLRRAGDRRQALIEIDAIVAIMIGITAEELVTIYRTQFPVLRRYEREARYDRTGRQLPTKLAAEYRKKGSLKDSDLTVDGITYRGPFVGVDRERDMELAYKHFSSLIERR